MTTPARQRIDSGAFLARSEKILDEFRRAEKSKTIEGDASKSVALDLLARDYVRAESPMLRFEHALVPWNKHVIMPVFALANAGVVLGAGAARALAGPVSLGLICGLVFGKPIGIVLFSWLATRSRVAAMLDGVSWRQVVGVGMLCGIGFTMSLFIANLAFGDAPLLETAKVAILAASVASGAAGVIILLRRGKALTPPTENIRSQ
jgi:NhaA family Na+:H+ antiporter